MSAKDKELALLVEAAAKSEREACIAACRSVLEDADRDGFSEYWVVQCIEAIKARDKS